jgi:steroid delta-isomerase-like uncharacterized protein
MGQDENLRVFDEWITAHRAHDLDKLVSLLTDDIAIQSSAGSSMPPANGKEEARVHWGTIFKTFPDMRMELVDLTPGENRVFAEISHGGTMKGNMGDWEPTGKEYRTNGAFRIEFREGKIRSILSYWDTATMLRQLGLIPGPE